MSLITIKRNDVGRIISDNLGMDLTGATVVFVMKNTADATVVRIGAVLVNAPAGDVKVILAAEHTSTVATFQAEWEITFSGGDTLTVPDGDYHVVEIVEDLG